MINLVNLAEFFFFRTLECLLVMRTENEGLLSKLTSASLRVGV